MKVQLLDVYDGVFPREDAAVFLYRVLERRDPLVNISHRAMPTFSDHLSFIGSRPYRWWYLITANETWVGTFSVTWANEIGLHLLPEHRRQGIGTQTIAVFVSTHRPNPARAALNIGRWLANIAPGNARSQQFFASLGFQPIQETWAYPEEETNGHEEASNQAKDTQEAGHP